MGLNSINTNISAYYAQMNIGKASTKATSSIARLSSGNRIVRAADDVAAMSAGTSLRTNVTTLRMALINTSQGSSMLQVADGALSQVTDILQRQKAIAVQAGSGSLTSQERSFLNQEFQNLTSEIDRLASQTNFNGVTLLDGSLFDITKVGNKQTEATKSLGSVAFSQNVVSGVVATLQMNGVSVRIGSAANVAAGTADLERGTSLQGTLDNLVNFLNSSTNTSLSGASYTREGNSLVVNQRAGGQLGQTFTIDNSIARSTALSSTGTTAGARIGSVSGDAAVVRYEQLLGFGAAVVDTNAFAAVTVAGGAGLLQVGNLVVNNKAGGTTNIALTANMTLNNVIDAVNAVSDTTGVTAKIIGDSGAYGLQFDTTELADVGLNAPEAAAGNLLETGTTGKLQIRSDRISAALLSTDIGAGAILTDTAAWDVNGLGGTTNVAATGSLVDFCRAAIRDYSVMEEGATAETNLGLTATVEWVDSGVWQLVFSSDTQDIITVGAGGAAVGTNNIDANTATQFVDMTSGDNNGLRKGATVATGTIGDTILNTLNNSRSSVTMSFADITNANLVANLNRELIGFTNGNNAAVNAAGESAGALTTFQFFSASTAGTVNTTFDDNIVQIGSTLNDTLDNLVGAINNYFNNGENNALALKQVEARREGRNVIIEYTGVGDVNNRESTATALAVYTNVAQTDMALSGASTDAGTGFGGVTGSTAVQYASLNSGAATGIDASNVINKDFVGKISGFKADFSGTNNRVNLTVKVGETTYTANSVNTSVTSNTTVRLNSEAGGYLDIQFAANTGTAVDSQDKADIFATRINQAFSTVNFYQDRVVDSYNAAGDIITNSAVTGSLTGTSFNLQLSDFSDVKIDNISVTAPPEGATDGIIEFAINGETYRGISNIGNKLAANSIYRFTSLTNPNNSLEFRTGSTAINFDTAQKADNFEAALKNAFGIGAAGSGQSLKFQVGVTTSDTLSVRLNSIATSKLYGGATLDVLTAATAAKAADALDTAIDTVTAVRAEVGALQSRFDFAAANIESSIQNQDAARGVLLDTDIASESSAFSTAQVQLQAGISVLAQANQLPQSLLKLIG